MLFCQGPADRPLIFFICGPKIGRMRAGLGMAMNTIRLRMVNGENLFRHGSPKLVPPAPRFWCTLENTHVRRDTRRQSAIGKGIWNESDEIRIGCQQATLLSETRRDTLTITDNRNGRQYEIPVKNDTIRAIDLRQIKIHDADFGMMSYDPAFTNTASCTSKITFIDGDKGILRYRGYSIEELAEKSTYL